MPGITSEVVANSNSQGLIFSTNIFANTTANGSAARVSFGGFVSPGVFGSNQYPATVLVNMYVGANGTSADPLVSQYLLPLVSGSFDGESIITIRANAKAAGATANAVYTGLVVDPISAQIAIAANGNVNSAMSASNTANISIYALAGSGQNASLVFEHCFATLLT